LPSLNPRSGVFESQNPLSKYFLLFLCRVVTPVVRENATLKVRHDSQVATILTCQSGYIVIRTVRVCRVAFVSIFSNYVVLALSFWELGLTCSVSCPHSQRTS